jgi:hypothetical protein
MSQQVRPVTVHVNDDYKPAPESLRSGQRG